MMFPWTLGHRIESERVQGAPKMGLGLLYVHRTVPVVSDRHRHVPQIVAMYILEFWTRGADTMLSETSVVQTGDPSWKNKN
jgi:hypothetical protein